MPEAAFAVLFVLQPDLIPFDFAGPSLPHPPLARACLPLFALPPLQNRQIFRCQDGARREIAGASSNISEPPPSFRRVASRPYEPFCTVTRRVVLTRDTRYQAPAESRVGVVLFLEPPYAVSARRNLP